MTTRDRALAELVRLRGWADEAAIQRAIQEASSAAGARDLGAILAASGVLTPNQLRELEAAMDGRPSGAQGSGSSSALDRTVAKSDAGVTIAAASGRKVGDTVGPYRILRELGRGGMGVVYRALQPELRREVALKVMLSGGDESSSDVERFRREAAVVARMGRHPSLVQIHDIGRDGERLYFTMDFIEGRSLKQRIAEEGPLSGREAARIAADLASALAFSHAAGVVHRDVKPANVLMDREERAFLGDFGLARDLSSSVALTQSGAPIGTPAYMSPEQAEGRASRITPLSDVYSLGATLYEMLTGRPPFDGESQMDIIRQVLERDPVPPRSLRPEIHRDLDVICLKAMHKVPARRYESAAALEADLRRFLNNDPILARPPGFGEKLVSRARRHRVALAAAACVLFAGAGFGGWAAWRVKKRDDAESDRARTQRAKQDEYARRQSEVTPLLIEGKDLMTRWDDARKVGDWRGRNRFAAAAIATLTRAAEIFPEGAEVHFQLGMALRRGGWHEKALASLERAVSIDPLHTLAWFEHGDITESRLREVRGSLVRTGIVAIQGSQGFVPTGMNRTLMFRKEAGEGDAPRLLETAKRDFRRTLETGAGAERAAYGRAMLAFYADRFDEALRELDAALAANPYFTDALEARASILEFSTRDMARGIADREAIHRLEPYNPWYTNELALSFQMAGRDKEALALVAEAVLNCDHPDVLTRGASIRFSSGDYDGCLELAKRALATREGSRAGRADAAIYVPYVAMMRREFDAALRGVDELEGDLGPDFAGAMRGEIQMARGDMGASARAFRGITPGSYVEQVESLGAAFAEWWCGNLDRARPLSETAVRMRVLPAAPVIRGIVRMDQGDLAGALGDFETVRRDEPALNVNYSNLAGARFLTGDYTGAITALEEAVSTTLTSPEQKEAVKRFFEPLAKRAGAAKSPAEAAKVVEGIAGLLVLAGAQATDETMRAGVREAQRGVFYILQAFYIHHEMWKEAIGAGERIGRITKSGSAMYKDAVARARGGRKPESVLKSLESALEAGFDDGKRVDGEKAFDALRNDDAFKILRSRCR
ncbi:MAG: protein kinase [Planctomycetota bacterium]